jgi:hypothetical protein
MTSSQLQEYARFGAQARLQAIEEERRAIVRAFPDLGRASGRTNGASTPSVSGRKGMSPSQRRAVGERMKAYWAKRRGETAGTEDADSQAAPDAQTSPTNRTSNRTGMSPAARKAQGERMRAYRAAKRAGKAGAAGADAPSKGASPVRKDQRTARKK